MKRTIFRYAVLATGAFAGSLCGSSAHAQSSDALLDKLVDKGILTVKEATELRHETDKDFTKAYSAKSGLPDWVTSLRINGDMRARYENFASENNNDLANDGLLNGNSFVDRSRFRYRLRLGVVATIKDNLEVGVRLTSDDPTGNFGGDPISGNTTFQDNGAKKFVYLDLAYGKWTFINTKPLTEAITLGKMENPFVFSDMIFDADYTPEGAAYNLMWRASDAHTVKFNAGAFVLDELGGDSKDPWMYGAQVRWDATWSKAVASSMGIAALNIVNDQSLTNGAVPAVNRGNTRAGGTGPLAFHMNPIVADASVTYTLVDGIPVVYQAPFPIKLAGDYINNPAADSREQGVSGGITFGKAGKKGLWEVSYRYKYLGGDAWYEELVDSDFGAFYQGTLPNSGSGAGYGAGTNVRGHVVKASYSLFDALQLNVTYFGTMLINEIPASSVSNMRRLQVDAVWKF
jgi:Putative porin